MCTRYYAKKIQFTNLTSHTPIEEREQQKYLLAKAEYEKEEKKWKDHTLGSQKERQAYRESVIDTRKHYSEVKEKQERGEESTEETLHLSVDAMRTMKFPEFRDSPQAQEIFFMNGIKVHSLGVYDEGAEKGYCYLWDETGGTVCADTIINILWRHIQTYRRGQKKLRWTFDNCSTNKNWQVTSVISSRTHIGTFTHTARRSGDRVLFRFLC